MSVPAALSAARLGPSVVRMPPLEGVVVVGYDGRRMGKRGSVCWNGEGECNGEGREGERDSDAEYFWGGVYTGGTKGGMSPAGAWRRLGAEADVVRDRETFHAV